MGGSFHDWRCTCGCTNFERRSVCRICGITKTLAEPFAVPMSFDVGHCDDVIADEFADGLVNVGRATTTVVAEGGGGSGIIAPPPPQIDSTLPLAITRRDSSRSPKRANL